MGKRAFSSTIYKKHQLKRTYNSKDVDAFTVACCFFIHTWFLSIILYVKPYGSWFAHMTSLVLFILV